MVIQKPDLGLRFFCPAAGQVAALWRPERAQVTMQCSQKMWPHLKSGFRIGDPNP